MRLDVVSILATRHLTDPSQPITVLATSADCQLQIPLDGAVVDFNRAAPYSRNRGSRARSWGNSFVDRRKAVGVGEFKHTDSADSRNARSGDARILDLTSRLPTRELPSTTPSRRLSGARFIPWGGGALIGALLGVVLGSWTALQLKDTTARRQALALIASLNSQNGSSVVWPAQENRPLRVIGFAQDRHLPFDARPVFSRPVVPLTPLQQRTAELWLLEAASEGKSSDALPALAAYHLSRPEEPGFLVLADRELEPLLQRSDASSGVVNDRAVVLALLGQTTQAMRLLDGALSGAPWEPALLFNAAQIARGIGPAAFQQELEYLQRYLAIADDPGWRSQMDARLHDMRFGARLEADFGAIPPRPIDPMTPPVGK